MAPKFVRPALLALGSALVFVPASGRAGCLTPTDTVVDAGVGSGPFWGNDAGSLLYVRQGAAGGVLVLRPAAGLSDQVAASGDGNGFNAGTQPERWDAFVSGTVNAQGDVAFVAATKPDDDPGTPEDESVSRRGVYAQRGNTLYEIARFGNPSPVRDLFNNPVPWGSTFDAVAADRDEFGSLRALFSGQLAGDTDHRFGLFRWSEQSPATATPEVLTGDPAPSGGSFSAIGRVRGNGPGDAAFFAVTQQTVSSPQIPGLFLLRSGGATSRIVRLGTDGDAAPGGGKFGALADFDLDDAGVAYFAATVEGGTVKSGLFRAKPPFFVPERLLAEGAPTPIAGTFGPFTSAVVRANATGELALAVPLSEDVGADGLFTLPVDSTEPLPLVPTESAVSVAALGAGRAGYETPDQVRIAMPSDGSEQGPTDFRIASLDLRDAALGPKDTLKFDGRLMLPPWGTGPGEKPPATFRGDAVRNTPAGPLTGAALAKIAEVKLYFSTTPGNGFAFGISGSDTAPAGSFKFNGAPQTVTKLTVSADGSAATWKFSGNPGPGSLTVDLALGTIELSVAKAFLQGGTNPTNYRVAFVLRTADDVAQTLPDDQSYFFRDLRISADSSAFGSGRRIASKGERVPGGTVFVDSLRVTRKPAKGGAPAADAITLSGTLRICPGTVAPSLPRLAASISVGEFALDSVPMVRVGRAGSSYRYKAAGVDLRADLVKGTFALKASGVAALAELADPSAAPGNDAKARVGGMDVLFGLSIPRVYEVSYRVPMTRLPGGKVFTR